MTATLLSSVSPSNICTTPMAWPASKSAATAVVEQGILHACVRQINVTGRLTTLSRCNSLLKSKLTHAVHLAAGDLLLVGRDLPSNVFPVGSSPLSADRISRRISRRPHPPHNSRNILVVVQRKLRICLKQNRSDPPRLVQLMKRANLTRAAMASRSSMCDFR